MITSPEIEKYCEVHSEKTKSIFAELHEATKKFAPQAFQMQVGNIEGQFLELLVKLSGASRIVEFGTFTGCSSLHFAFATPSHGLITTLDRDPKAVALAQNFWEKAGVSKKIESKVGLGKNMAQDLVLEIEQRKREPYDLAFIDADKAGYSDYFELSLRLVKRGGWIVVDNVLWSGAVLNPKEDSDKVIHSFNDKIKSDSRVEVLMLPIRDGISIARKKS